MTIYLDPKACRLFCNYCQSIYVVTGNVLYMTSVSAVGYFWSEYGQSEYYSKEESKYGIRGLKIEERIQVTYALLGLIKSDWPTSAGIKLRSFDVIKLSDIEKRKYFNALNFLASVAWHYVFWHGEFTMGYIQFLLFALVDSFTRITRIRRFYLTCGNNF